MKKRLLAFGAATLLPALAIAAACSFPDPTYVSIEAGSEPDAAQDATLDVPDGNRPDTSDVDPNGRDADAGMVDATVLDEASVEAGCCDCDGDGFQSANPGCNPSPGMVDCDDLVFAINPGVSDFILNAWPSSKHKPVGDWNCDGVTTKQLNHDLQCGAGFLTCPPDEGFEGDPGCGQTTNFFKCTVSGLACTPASPRSVSQGCK